MKQTATRLILIVLVATMLLGLCGCDLFANFNDGMPSKRYVGGYYVDGYDPTAAQEAAALRETIAWIVKLALLAAVGIVGIAAPKALWWVVIGWQIKDAEPSDAALVIYRIIGAVLLIVSAVLTLKSF